MRTCQSYLAAECLFDDQLDFHKITTDSRKLSGLCLVLPVIAQGRGESVSVHVRQPQLPSSI
jgi:hypothetical protein